MQQELFKDNISTNRPSRGGPPNRMNDLNYTEWMKFQKSFFRFVNLMTLSQKCVHFFTKAIWPDGSPSRSLLLSTEPISNSDILPPRIVEAHRFNGLHDLEKKLASYKSTKQLYDFVLIDMRKQFRSAQDVSVFLVDHSKQVFSTLRDIVSPDRYSCILVGLPEERGMRFPAPWSIAHSARKFMKLRDEKVALIDDKKDIFFCIFLQATDDARIGEDISPHELKSAKPPSSIPLWIIPKPPPRKRNEILHPAKFPETLIGQFIEMFSKPGDPIFDPMVGTGSTVVAALQRQRNGYGVDLIPEFVEIAKQRVAAWDEHCFLPEMSPNVKSLILQGDATKLNRIKQLAKLKFKYAVTSPPYWSMLTNPGSEGQRKRRKEGLRLVYSDNKLDLGNISDYKQFLNLLEAVYNQVAEKLVDDGVLTVIVKNIKRDHVLYCLAWDLTAILCGSNGRFKYLGTTLWCQDDVGLKPFAVGTHWVSNTLHQYCLHYRKR